MHVYEVTVRRMTTYRRLLWFVRPWDHESRERHRRRSCIATDAQLEQRFPAAANSTDVAIVEYADALTLPPQTSDTEPPVARERLAPLVEAMREAAHTAAWNEWLCWQEETPEHEAARSVCTRIEDRIRAITAQQLAAIIAQQEED